MWHSYLRTDLRVTVYTTFYSEGNAKESLYPLQPTADVGIFAIVDILAYIHTKNISITLIIDNFNF